MLKRIMGWNTVNPDYSVRYRKQILEVLENTHSNIEGSFNDLIEMMFVPQKLQVSTCFQYMFWV